MSNQAEGVGGAPRRLWTFKDYADFLAVSERTAAEMEAQGLLADPVVLGPRMKRYIPDECEAKLRSMPRARPTEPGQLVAARRARIEAMKGSGARA